MIREKKARVWAWMPLTTKSGQRAVVEQIDEFRYGTEFDPSVVALAQAGAVPLPGVEPAVFHMAPTAFETRNLGVTFEVEPVIGPDGETIDINMVPQHVRLLRMNQVTIGRENTGERVVLEQPEMHTMKVTTSLSMKNGDSKLLGMFDMPEEKDRMELFIVRVTLQTFSVRYRDPAISNPARSKNKRNPFPGGAPGG